jgi:hypothetical protein
LSASKPSLPPIIDIADGEVLHRVHGESRDARWYGRKDATSRWDDPNGEFGVLYLGRSPVGAFSESLLRAPADPDVLWRHVVQKRQATFRLIEPIQLVKLHGAGLAWFGVTAADIAEADYALPQKIANRVHGSFPVDGVQYRSRFDNDELCVALFDRADGKIELVSEGELIEKVWTAGTLATRGYRLIEL